MSNRTIFLLVVASAVSIFSLWLVWKDGLRYPATVARDDKTADTTLIARPIGRAEFVQVDSNDFKFTGRLSGENIFPPVGNKYNIFTEDKPDTFIEWEARPANDDFYIIPDSMVGKVIFPKCTWENGDVSYLVKINDSTFVILRLPAGRVEANTDFMDKYFTRVK